MISEEQIYNIEDAIVDSDNGSEVFLSTLIEQKSQLALWLTSENFELFSEKEFATLVLISQVLITAFDNQVDLSKLEIDEISEVEEKYYELIQKKGREGATIHLSQAEVVKNQPEIYDYLVEFIEDIEESLDLDKTVYDAFWVSVMTIFTVIEQNTDVS